MSTLKFHSRRASHSDHSAQMSVGLLALILLAALVPSAIAQMAAAGPVSEAQARRVFSKQSTGPSMTKPKSFFRQAQGGSTVPGQVYVCFRAEAAHAQRQAAHALARMNREERPFGLYLPDTVLAHVAPGRERHAINAYLDNPDVIYAEPVYLVETSAIPNDPGWIWLWGMSKIRAPDAWDVTTGDPNFTIGVVDSGLNFTHPDLAANVWTNRGEIPGNGIDDDNNGFVDDVRGWHFVNGNNIITDNNPVTHGTHVSGTIGAVGNNSTGVAGVNWRCKILMAACGVTGTRTLGNTAQGLAYLLTNGVKISNHSYGSASFSQTEFAMFSRAQQEGHIAVCAAGNSMSDNDATPLYPASYALDNIIAVASHDALFDLISTFSNWGATTVDIAAPGSDIVSTVRAYETGIAALDGTSMASPLVTGVIALVWSRYPNLTWQEVRARVLTGGIPVAGLVGKVSSGKRLDAVRPMGVWVQYGTSLGSGTIASPSPSIPDALPLVPSFGHLFVRAPSANFSGRLGDKPMRIESYGGAVRIGP